MKPRSFLPLLLSLAVFACSDGGSGTDPDPSEPSSPPTSPPPGVVPSVGDVYTFRFPFSQTGNLCTTANPDIIEGRVVAVTPITVIIVDTENPSGGLSDAEYASFGPEFDEIGYAVVTQNFGEPSDIDGNGRVLALFTRAVNELSQDQNGFVAGLHWAGNLLPRTSSDGLQGCPNSNEAEIFFMAVADPNGIAGPELSRDQILRSSVSTMGHELQHLVNAARRIFVNAATGFEEVWLDEGLSHATEELMFYHSAGLSPGGNITIDILRESQARLDAANRFQISNVGRYAEFLQTPDTVESSLLNAQAGVPLGTRGAIWNFLRYAADRRGGSQQSFWSELGNAQNAGLDNLQVRLGTDPMVWFHDWSAAVFADDAAPVEPRFRFPSWNLRSIYPAFRDGQGNQVFPEFPLRVDPLDDENAVELEIAGSAAAYVEVHAPANGEVQVTIRSGGAAPPSTLRLSGVNQTTGEVVQRSGPAAEEVALSGGNGETRWVLAAFHASSAPSAILSLSFSSEGAAAAGEFPGALLTVDRLRTGRELHPGTLTLDETPSVEVVREDHGLHLELMERARRELTPLIPAARSHFTESPSRRIP
jgi:hypothetical protein